MKYRYVGILCIVIIITGCVMNTDVTTKQAASKYRSSDAGASWLKFNDISQTLEGYVTGVSFRNEQVGRITATQHGPIHPFSI